MLLYAQVFASFIEGFGSAYEPLLRKVQRVLDEAITDGLRNALDNVQLRSQLLGARRATTSAVGKARVEVLAGMHSNCNGWPCAVLLLPPMDADCV